MSRPITVTSERRRIPGVDPLAAYARLRGRFGAEGTYLLESLAGPADDARYSFVGFGRLLGVEVAPAGREAGVSVRFDGRASLIGKALRATRGDLRPSAGAGERPDRLWLDDPHRLWDVLRAIQGQFAATGSADRFDFGFLAFLGYDCAHYIEDLPRLIDSDPGVPDVGFVLFQGLVRIDHRTGDTDLVVHQSDHWPDLDPTPVADLLATAGTGDPDDDRAPDVPADAGFLDDTTEREFLATAETCQHHIGIGDIYQVQVGHELTIRSDADPVDVYRRLCGVNPSPYMYLAPLSGRTLVGASPELFVRVAGGEIVMRPIAGTLPRGAQDDDAATEAAARVLRDDPKEIAEHVMLVDLCRNDIGRVCRPGSLAVPQMMTVERYSHVLHLVSTVTGAVDGESDSYDVITALFPAGTMTGAPKIRAMEIIESLENSRRGIYAGAVGLVDVGGYVNLALCIRTLVHGPDGYRTRASAGVVADSVPRREWRETLAKIGAAYWATTGKELVS